MTQKNKSTGSLKNFRKMLAQKWIKFTLGKIESCGKNSF